MKTAIFLLGSVAVAAGCSAASLTLILPGTIDNWRVPVGVGLPVGATWILMAAYLVRSAWNSSSHAKELSAQLMRREIELGRTSTVDELTGLATRARTT